MSWIAWCVCVWLIPLGVIGSIWYPYAAHLYWRDASIPLELVARLRQTPPGPELGDVARRDVVAFVVDGLEQDAVETAIQLLAGEITLTGNPTIKVHTPFAPEDIQRLPAGWQLGFHGFAAPRLYLQAYEQTGREIFLEAARDYILAWSAYERAQWKPEGMMWNDHAIAQRAQVLIRFWYDYRGSAIFSAPKAQGVLKLVVRTGTMLSDPALYTFRTNHGVMQNLELLQLRLAFPSIAAFKDYAALSRNRLDSQMLHYLNEEGAILEHSAGYHAFGVALLGAVLHDFALLGVAVPKEWTDRYTRSLQVLAELRRPDGTLPRWGDTGAASRNDPPAADVLATPEAVQIALNWRPETSSMLLPADGIAVWWHGLKDWPSVARLSQSFVTWSYFEPLGHKHPDELSFILWARGTNWWTSEGYLNDLPPGAQGGSDWDGSNAPHLIGESPTGRRHSRLLGFTSSEELTAIDLERKTDDGFTARRQLIQFGGDCWITIDSLQDLRERSARTVWLTSPQITAMEAGESAFKLIGAADGDKLQVDFLSAVPAHLMVVRGNLNPLIGWVEEHGAQPTTAIVLEQPSKGSWAISVATLGLLRTEDDGKHARVRDWQDAEHWNLVLPALEDEPVLSRNGSEVWARFRDGRSVRTTLSPGPDNSTSVASVLAAYRSDVERYDGPLRELWSYRVRMSLVLIGLFVAQQIVLTGLARWRPVTANSLAALALLGWSGIAAWLWTSYF